MPTQAGTLRDHHGLDEGECVSKVSAHCAVQQHLAQYSCRGSAPPPPVGDLQVELYHKSKRPNPFFDNLIKTSIAHVRVRCTWAWLCDIAPDRPRARQSSPPPVCVMHQLHYGEIIVCNEVNKIYICLYSHAPNRRHRLDYRNTIRNLEPDSCAHARPEL